MIRTRALGAVTAIAIAVLGVSALVLAQSGSAPGAQATAQRREQTIGQACDSLLSTVRKSANQFTFASGELVSAQDAAARDAHKILTLWDPTSRAVSNPVVLKHLGTLRTAVDAEV